MEDCSKINLKKRSECGCDVWNQRAQISKKNKEYIPSRENVYDTGSIKDIIALIPMKNAGHASISVEKNAQGYIWTYFGSAQQVVNLMLKKNNLTYEYKENICPFQHISKHYRMLLG